MHGTNCLKALTFVRLHYKLCMLVVLNTLTLIYKVSVTKNLVLVFVCLFELVCCVRNCNLTVYFTVCAFNGVSGLRVLHFY